MWRPGDAIGLLEVRGLSKGIAVLDTVAKASDIRLIDVKKDMGGGLVTITIAGGISAVMAAVEAGRADAETTQKYIASKVLASPHPQTAMYLDGTYKKRQRRKYRREAYGIIEVYGFVCAVAAADAALKAANVNLIGMERTKGDRGIELIVALKVTGSPDAARCAVEAGLAAAVKVGDIISSRVNALPDEGIFNMVKYTNLKSD